MHKIGIWRDPYDTGYNICEADSLELEPGLTVLVGCNGAGKTTLLNNIESYVKNNKLPLMQFDNLQQGRDEGVSAAAYDADWGAVASLITSSEGEQIRQNFGKMVCQARNFLKTGEIEPRTKSEKLMQAILSFNSHRSDGDSKTDSESLHNVKPKDRWILIDALDSGYSINNIVEFKALCGMMLADAHDFGVNLYIVVTANAYEVANGEKCIDVTKGTKISFSNYEEYKAFILHTSEVVQERRKS